MNRALEVRGLTKRFPGVVALEGVDCEVRRGEVHALLGANGAGKSTLIHILAGLFPPDAGEVRVAGRPLLSFTPQGSRLRGIRVVFQELSLVPTMTVEENILLDRLPRRWGCVDRTVMRRKAREALGEMGGRLDPSAKVSHLSVSQQQVVEIARTVSSRAALLALDEPTSALSTPEVKALHVLLRGLKERGVGILYVSHRMQELFDVSDRITVLRDGRWVATVETRKTCEEELVKLMVGKKQSVSIPWERRPAEGVLLEVSGLSTSKLREVSLSVRVGEVVGVWGLMGAGKTELARALFGIDPLRSGRVSFRGRGCSVASPREARRIGWGWVPEDRKGEGLVLPLSVRSNLTLASLDRIGRWGVVRRAREGKLVEEAVGRLKIRLRDPSQMVRTLSGGNQQKVVIARWLMRSVDLLILDEPTRGVDVTAKVEIYRWVRSFAAQGMAILLLSSEVEEVLGLCDRVWVLAEGRVRGIFDHEEATEEKLMGAAVSRDSA
jgi:ABC-type sugar transport system ATPase subunit